MEAGLPWFDYYDADASDLAASGILSTVKCVGEVLGVQENSFTPVDPKTVIALGATGNNVVSDGDW